MPADAVLPVAVNNQVDPCEERSRIKFILDELEFGRGGGVEIKNEASNMLRLTYAPNIVGQGKARRKVPRQGLKFRDQVYGQRPHLHAVVTVPQRGILPGGATEHHVDPGLKVRTKRVLSIELALFHSLLVQRELVLWNERRVEAQGRGIAVEGDADHIERFCLRIIFLHRYRVSCIDPIPGAVFPSFAPDT